jgi:hypothetical protein
VPVRATISKGPCQVPCSAPPASRSLVRDRLPTQVSTQPARTPFAGGERQQFGFEVSAVTQPQGDRPHATRLSSSLEWSRPCQPGAPRRPPVCWSSQVQVGPPSLPMHTSSHINASLAGLVGVPGLAAYAAAKHGVMGLTQAAALDCASQAVRVNALVTDNVDTPLFRRFRGARPTANSRSRRRTLLSGSPSRRSSLPSPSCSVRGRFHHPCGVGHRWRPLAAQ